MLPACRTEGEGFAIPTFDVVPSDVEGFMDELQEFQSAFHDCFPRSEPRAHFFDYMVGQFSKLERKSIEPMALQVEGGTIRGLQRFISDGVWDEEQMVWNYHQLVAEEMGDPDGVLMFDQQLPLYPKDPMRPMSAGSRGAHCVPQESRLTPPAHRESKQGMIL